MTNFFSQILELFFRIEIEFSARILELSNMVRTLTQCDHHWCSGHHLAGATGEDSSLENIHYNNRSQVTVNQ